ncbi:tetratricopeptide repeat protein [Sulfurisoma sediminicola]|uniref:Tetratricopeptide repeat protein n=2 Tax=Sulfurisoma sediminicola TaxID=1381557 RepID=A0A497X8K8_9PROT|nr:tetratricopeptide repeat protein [Sulfurisoma sediminicola]
MKRAIASIVLVLTASAALALPTPKDIATAVNSGQLSQAEAMLHEVIKEKPASAKAHYELGQLLAREGRKIEARQELLEARRLDPSLKFATDPKHFNELLDRLPESIGAPVTSPAAATLHPAVVAPAAPQLPWGFMLLGGGAILVIWLFMRRSASAPVMTPSAASATGGSLSGGGFGYGPGTPIQPQAAGSGLGGAMLGGIAGMAAGYGLAKVLESGSENQRIQPARDNSSFIPVDSSPQVDFGAFDAGSGDSWDSADAGPSDERW